MINLQMRAILSVKLGFRSHTPPKYGIEREPSART